MKEKEEREKEEERKEGTEEGRDEGREEEALHLIMVFVSICLLITSSSHSDRHMLHFNAASPSVL